MKMRRTKALLLALMMLGSMLLMCACDGAGTSTPTTVPAPTGAKATYKVTLADVQGNPYNANIVVSFLQNGESVGMQPVDENGVATKELPLGEYTIALTITDGKTYHYNTDEVQLTAENTEATLVMANVVGTENESLFVNEMDHIAPYVEAGCTYLEVTAGVRNYFIFTPKQSGIYTFTLCNAEGEIGYYGGTFFVLDTNGGTPVGDQAFEYTISDGMIGTESSGTTKMVIGIDVAEGVSDCVLSIARTGNYIPKPEETAWVDYVSTYNPTKYTLPEGLTIQEFDLTSSYNLVYNAADGYYHLDSENGPVVLVRMATTEDSSYGYFDAILANSNVGVYEYDEDGNFVKRVSFNACLLKYLGTLSSGMGSFKYENGNLDDTYGVYPLTSDLMYIIQTYGDYAGWWNPTSTNYLFAGMVGLNTESAWLFMCCYAQ